MEQKNDELDLEVEDIEEIVETKDGDDNDTTDWQAEALKRHGIAKRFKTKLEKIKKNIEDGVFVKATAEKKPEAPAEKKEFDYAELAFIEGRGILDKEDQSWLFQEAKNTGKEVREILDFNYVKEELKSKKDTRASRDAIPSGSPRSSPSTRDSVEYWIAKGELPPADQPELRRQVVNAKIKKEEAKSKFSDFPPVV